LTDADLLLAARRGDGEAWQTLHARYLPAVWRQAYAQVADVHAAEDITSETMLAMLRGIDRIDAEAPKIAGWLAAVVRFKVADYQRTAIRAREKLSLAAASGMDGAATSPSAPLEVAETREAVLSVLRQLGERYRIVLEWKYIDSLGVRQIAERLGETEKAVEAVLYRARREFRRLFDLQQARQGHEPSPSGRVQGEGALVVRPHPDPLPEGEGSCD
jgi:RNA polymerase sigma-70 factor (ECF subfamily)